MKKLVVLIALFTAGTLSPLLAEQVIITEINYHPEAEKPEFVEVYNNTTTPRDICNWELRGGVNYDFPGFSEASPQEAFLHKYQRIILTGVTEAEFRQAYPSTPADVRIFGPWTGQLSDRGETITLKNKNDVVESTIDYRDRGKWPRSADGAGHTLVIKNTNQYSGDWRNWGSSISKGGTPGAPPESPEGGQPIESPEIDLSSGVPVVTLDDTWKFFDETEDLGTAWREPDFDDSGWKSGPGFFGFETRTLPEPGIQTAMRRDSAGGLTTYYLRKEFNFNKSVAGSSITFSNLLDDGAVYYINGQEVGRVRMPDGPVDWKTTATKVPAEGVVEEDVITSDGSAVLVPGRNVLAVEVHNDFSGSSDLVFAAQMGISAPSAGAIINEVSPGTSGFLEFFNPLETELNMKDHYVTDDVANLTKYKIGTDMVIGARDHGSIDLAGTGLATSPSQLFLVDPDGSTVMNGVTVATADGTSISRKPSGSATWFIFSEPQRDGANVGLGDLRNQVGFSEVHLNAAQTAIDWVEFYANGAGTVDLNGMFVASKLDFSDKVALSEMVPANGYRSFDVNFPLENGNVTLYLITSGNNVVAADRFEPRFGQVSIQEFPAGSSEWYSAAAPTRDAINNPIRTTSIVINEIMADPPSDSRNGEFIELYNRGNEPVDLGGWSFSDGVSYTFPSGTTLAPGAYLVVTANTEFLNESYPGIRTVGNFTGILSNEGELLRLEDATGSLADQVDYSVGGDWPKWVKGGGSSFELVNPNMDNDLPTAWRDSDESAKSTFKTFTASGEFFQLERQGRASDYLELHLHLTGDSHIILKNIKITKEGSNENLLGFPGVISPDGSGDNGWRVQGTHWASYVAGDEFHLIADGHGDNRANKAEQDLPDLEDNDKLDIEFDARWVAGRPRLIAQTFDHSFCPTFDIGIPNNLGTPGAQNSRFQNQPAPSVQLLGHSPAVPTSSDPVVVTARVSSPIPTQKVEIVYREDSDETFELNTTVGVIQSNSAAPWKTAVMNDNGLSGDVVPGDGIYSGTITDMGEDERIVQFYVRATSEDGQENYSPVNGENRPALYVVDDSVHEDDDDFDPNLTTYRWVLSDWDNRAFGRGGRADYDYRFPLPSNSYKNMTLIVNESEIYYNCEIRPSASPWHQGDRSNLDKRGKWKMPPSNTFRNTRKITWDNTLRAEGAGALHHNNLIRYWLYLLGHPVNEDEYGYTIENAESPRFNELVEPVGADMLDRHFVNGAQGELYKIDDHFRFTDSYSKDQTTDRYWWYDSRARYPDPNGPGTYHTAWIKRSRESEYDYAPIVNFFKTMDDNDYTEEEINRLVHQHWSLLMIAVRGYTGDWDNITMTRPKNAYFYRAPDGGKWHFFHWDSDLAFRSGEPLFSGGSQMRNWYRKPYNQRILRYYFAQLFDRYTEDSPRIDAWLEAEEAVSPVRDYRVSSSYKSFFRTRARNVDREIDDHLLDPLVVDAPNATEDGIVAVTGTAGYRVDNVFVEGHPEAKFRWTDDTNWIIEGLALKEGENALNFLARDHENQPAFGEAAQTAATATIQKTGNSAPYIDLAYAPASLNVGVEQELNFDASASYDPESGTAEGLTYDWTTPEGLTSFVVAGATATATFSSPGIYTFKLKITDAGGVASQIEREVSVYGSGGFSSFNDPFLEPFLEEVNIEERDNFSPSAWYGLERIEPGKLTMQVENDSAKPVSFPAPELPAPTTYVDLGTTWKFDDSNQDLGTAFAATDFDDAAWKSGPGIFGFESRALPDPGIQTPLARDNANGLITYYFRTEFNFDKEAAGSELSIDNIVDDGARYFLNGKEVGRIRLPEGDIDSNTKGVKVGTEGVVEENVIASEAFAFLNDGNNVFAVEVHNDSAGSSDLVFGSKLHIAANEKSNEIRDLDDILHPWIRRALPDGDWSLNTKLELQGIEFGDFSTGLIVQAETGGGQKSRYLFGYDGGDNLTVRVLSANGVPSQLYSEAAPQGSLTLRIIRGGNQLHFGTNEKDVWRTVHTADLPAESVPSKGGIFLASEFPLTVRTSFDYLMLIDPSGMRSPLASAIQVSEVMYNPPGGSAYEYIELQNISAQGVDLSGVRFVDGQPFGELALSGTIPAGGIGLLVSDLAAFRERHGEGLNGLILGAWTGGNLANSGERVTLRDGNGDVIHSFAYDDIAPWPIAADGDGPSIELVDPSSAPDHSVAASWKASKAGGSPGDGAVAPEPGLLDFALGADLLGVPAESLISVGTMKGVGPTEFLTFSYTRRTDAPDLSYEMETSNNLLTWQISGQFQDVEAIDNGNGTTSITVRSTFLIGAEPAKYVRLQVARKN